MERALHQSQLTKELAERRPALLHLEYQQPLGGDLSLDLLHPLVEKPDS